MKELISVVVCTYNQENTIGRALDSVLSQQCSWPIEVIIGEDHSTDATLDVCRLYAERYPDIIRLLPREKNIGLVDNYYDCLMKAEGKYIADIAGDDEWCDSLKLEKELVLMEEREEVVLVHTDYQLRTEDTGEIRPAMPYWFDRTVSCGRNLTLANFRQRERPLVHLCTSLYRSSTFRECYSEHPDLFRGNKYPCEDLQLTTLLSTKGSFVYIDEVTLNYSISARSISNAASYEKQWYFVEGAARLRYDLACALSFQNEIIVRENLAFQTYVLLMHSFRLHRPDLRDRTLEDAEIWDVRISGKNRFLRYLMSSDVLWSFALIIRSIVLRMR